MNGEPQRNADKYRGLHVVEKPVSDEKLVERALAGDADGVFRELWDGNYGAYASREEASLMLSIKLALLTGSSAARMDALFCQSGLMSKEWEDVDYRDRVIGTALEFVDLKEKQAL